MWTAYIDDENYGMLTNKQRDQASQEIRGYLANWCFFGNMIRKRLTALPVTFGRPLQAVHRSVPLAFLNNLPPTNSQPRPKQGKPGTAACKH